MSASPTEIARDIAAGFYAAGQLAASDAGAGVFSLETDGEPPIFRGANLAIQSYRSPEFMLAGPSETGKTWATLWLLDSLLRETPKAQGGLLRKVAADIHPTVLVTYRRIIERSRSGAVAFGGEKPEWFDYPNGARLYVGGMDRPGKVLSGERDFLYVNQSEELTLNDWETLSTRTTGRGAVTNTPMLFGDCNPGPEDHWILKRELLKVFYSKHEDNPSLFDEDGNLTEQGKRTMLKLNALTGIRKARLRDGKWVGAEGLFFEEWDEELHTCEPFEIPADWPVWGALDIGRAHPTAWGGLTENDNTIYLFAEHVKNNWPIASHCKAIHRQLEIAKVSPARVRRTVAGHDAFLKRVDGDGVSPAELYEKAKDPETGEDIGIKLERATIDRVAGATRLLELLGNREIGIPPRLKIFRTCKRTIATITRMVHDPHDAEDVLKVNADMNGDGGDDCFVAGTMIQTSKGLIPIEEILPGDLALTRGGYQAVRAAWRSRINSTVLTATFSDGRTITGTPNHPFFIKGKGWISLDTLRYGDIMLPCQNATSNPKQSSSTESPSGAIQNRSEPNIESITRLMAIGLKEALGRSMLRYGSLFTERFLKGTIYTTLTKTLSTTALRTWLASQNGSTRKSISKALSDSLQPENILSELDRLLPSGIAQMRGARGTVRTPNKRGSLASLLSALVSNAVLSLTVSPFGAAIDSAQMPVSQNGVVALGWMVFRNHANDAERYLPQISTNRFASVRGNAAALRLVDLVEAGRANTYSLHINKHHEYFANGILVKNCYDMLRYGVMTKKSAKLMSW